MSMRFKCKRCKKRFDTNVGRSNILIQVDDCENALCPLKRKSLSYIPEKKSNLPMVITQSAANEEHSVEIYEDVPIGGLISFREVKKRNGF